MSDTAVLALPVPTGHLNVKMLNGRMRFRIKRPSSKPTPTNVEFINIKDINSRTSWSFLTGSMINYIEGIASREDVVDGYVQLSSGGQDYVSFKFDPEATPGLINLITTKLSQIGELNN